MRTFISLAATSALALALSACGGGADDAGSDTGEDMVTGEDTAVMDDAEGEAEDISDAMEEDDAAEGADDTEETTPETAASATPSAAATTAAAAGTPPPMFAVCSACHSVNPGENGIGPTLAGVFGAKAGHIASFDYSDAMKGSGLTWDQATLDRYLENPSGTVPGTKMAYNGLKNADQRKAVIDYLKTL